MDDDNWQYCSACSGSGQGMSGEDSKCNTCAGRGEVYVGEIPDELEQPEYDKDDDNA